MKQDYYENGDESDYYGIVRYARQKGIFGVVIEHQFISNPAHAVERILAITSKVDYIGWLTPNLGDGITRYLVEYEGYFCCPTG